MIAGVCRCCWCRGRRRCGLPLDVDVFSLSTACRDRITRPVAPLARPHLCTYDSQLQYDAFNARLDPEVKHRAQRAEYV